MTGNSSDKQYQGRSNCRSTATYTNYLPVLVSSLLLLLAVFSAGAGAVLAEEPSDDRFVRGEPDLEAHLPANTVVPGETQEIDVVVTNDGEVLLGSIQERATVTKARNVRATVESDTDAIEVESGTMSLGSITEDQPKSTSVQLTVAEDIDPGEYDLEVELEYSYTWQVSDRSGVTIERSTSDTQTITIDIDDNAQFIVRNTSTDALIGDSGELSLEMENVGEQPAYNVSVLTESKNQNVRFGDSTIDETYAGQWAPGERKTISHDVRIRDGTSVRPYTLDTSVTFEDGDGISQMDDGIISSISPHVEQTFTVEATESTLRVDDDGRIRGTITNDGPATVESVEIRAPLDDPNLFPVENSYAVGDLDPGETESFELHLDVGSEAKSVQKLIPIDVRYRTTDRDKRLYDDGDAIVVLGERRADFSVTSVTHDIPSGSTGSVTVDITNNLDETVTDVEPKLFTDEPLTAHDDTAYIPELAPGETVSVQFEVDIDDGTGAKTYAAKIDIRYDDADGTSAVSDTDRVPVTVIEPADRSNLPLLGGVLIVVIGLAAVLYHWKFR